ncbi:hypothetical protein [Campylobacter estrildidarum]|uniref:Lipoprotein n=1 Tax=Campylobacter estrildidarum TaxID=2510189 RepID=A0A4U7BMD5_9BACT|nr:hypothetical protein [Campylobacter estrildidarum]TKX31330.1 hypothetical protein CQA69_03545 [Campylobacter estrildidarum]
MKHFFIILFCLLFIYACGTKRQYFEPTHIDRELTHNANLKAKIIDWNLFSAKLNNGETILKNNTIVDNFKLDENYVLLAYQDGEFVEADNNGNLKIYSSAHEEIYSYKFDAAVIGIALNGDDLALVLADNSIIFANRSLGIEFNKTLTPAPAQDSRVANPIFLDNIILYPTLDGKIVVLSKNTFQIIKDIVVSAENFFNNVINLSIKNDKIVAVTAKRIAVINPARTIYLDADIKDIALSDNAIFIFEKDGNIIKTDYNLRKLEEKKFDFAIFTKVTLYNDHLYAFEKTGYLIKCDLNLKNIKVFKLSDATEEISFMGNGKFYFGNKILDLL